METKGGESKGKYNKTWGRKLRWYEEKQVEVKWNINETEQNDAIRDGDANWIIQTKRNNGKNDKHWKKNHIQEHVIAAF